MLHLYHASSWYNMAIFSSWYNMAIFYTETLGSCKFKKISLKSISTVPHSCCEFLEQASSIPQMNKPYTSSDSFVKHRDYSFPTLLSTANSEFSAALGHLLDLVWLRSGGKVFDIIHFPQRPSSFPACAVCPRASRHWVSALSVLRGHLLSVMSCGGQFFACLVPSS